MQSNIELILIGTTLEILPISNPQSGIDFKHYDYVRNVIITACNFYDNKKLDIINYNVNDIKIKNCNFNNGIGVTFGLNMNIHDNKFIYYRDSLLDKFHKGWPIGPNSVDKVISYFFIINNYFEGYNTGMGIQLSNIANSIFTKNLIVDC